MKLLLIAGIGVILAGLAAIGFGIPVKEFGFGNTLILTGTVGACTGLIMVSMALAVGELKKFGPQGEIDEPVPSPRLPRRELKLPSVPGRTQRRRMTRPRRPRCSAVTSRPRDLPFRSQVFPVAGRSAARPRAACVRCRRGTGA